MRRLAVPFLALVLLAGPVAAQERGFWVQIEAHPDRATAEARARAYDGLLEDVAGFRLSGQWHALALGPYTADEARARLRSLRAEGLVPRDSYVSDGDPYREAFWPEPGVVRTVAPEPAEPAGPIARNLVDETPQEARASETALDQEARKDLQRALAWFGHYAAGIDGSFGPGTRGAMTAWQREAGLPATGVLTSAQRADLMARWREGQAALGLGTIENAEAGVALTGPLGLVAFDRIEAPFVHYAPAGDSGVRLSLISQAGDAGTLAGLYEILQTLDAVPTEGPRAKRPGGFSIRGQEPGRTAQVEVRLQDGHIFGYLLSWPDAQAAAATRALAEMEGSLRSTGAPLDPEAGFDAETQSFDMVSGLELRRPLRSGSGFFVDGTGRVATAAGTVEGCGRVTIDRLHAARVAAVSGGVALLEPEGQLAPVAVASLAPGPGRLRAPVSVGGFPYGGVLGAATLTFGTLEDVRGLDGGEDVMRLSLTARSGDAGGPVFDAAGRVAGLLLPQAADPSRVLPADVSFAAKTRVLRGLLDEAGVAATVQDTAPSLAPEDLTARAAEVTVLVSCWE
jgi:peptidoglycan hydrolase-like protein with peptidoglycan-binding domain